MKYHLHYIDAFGQIRCSIQSDDLEDAENMLRRYSSERNTTLRKAWEFQASENDIAMIYVSETDDGVQSQS